MIDQELKDAKRQMIAYTLSKSVFGSELKPSDIEELSNVCTIRPVEKDEYLFHQGDPAKCFFIVHQGAIKVHRLLSDGREQVIHIFKTRESFAEVSLSGTIHYPVSAVAVESSQVLCVDCDKLAALLHKIPDLSLRIIASMSLRLKFLVGKLEQHNFQSADGRLASWILEQSSAGCEPRIEIRIKKKNIAAQLGITSETLSRTLNQFKKAEWIREEGKQWVLLNVPALRNCATSYNTTP